MTGKPVNIAEIDTSSFKDFDHHEKVLECTDEQSGLQAYIAVHNRNLGPALGGARMWPYGSRSEAITDSLRLSRGMTYKSAMAGLPLGGGKAVIVGDPRTTKTPALMRAMGRFIQHLDGAYITAEDSGTNVADLQIVATETRHVAGINQKKLNDGSQISGDPSPSTAYGVFVGIKASLAHRFGSGDLHGVSVAIQGVGNVGKRLAEFLVNAGARVVVADLYPRAIEELQDKLQVTVCKLDDIHRQGVEVFAPCALGGFLTVTTLSEITAPIIAGAANNQLAEVGIGRSLVDAGKLYAPDYVINSGGIIDIYCERAGYRHDELVTHIDRIGQTLEEIYALAEASRQPTHVIADRIAESRFLSPVGRINVA